MSSRQVTKTRVPRRPAETDLGFAWGATNGVLLAVGVVVLVAGYVALSRGSMTLAPILLVLGYLVFIPASILWRGRRAESGE
jgi:hypothetical protein